jgi:LysR family transcriptional regulator, transcriptional activator for dmlA
MTQVTQSSDMSFFALLAQAGSLTAAAHELRITTGAVSKRLSGLEKRLGVALLHRTTRRLGLTDAGRLYLENSRRILHEIEAVESELQGTRAEPSGLLRVNATLGFGRMHIGPAVAAFSRKHPRVEVQLQLSATPPAITEHAWDVAIRFGEPPESRLVARKLADNRRRLCASPAYLAREGAVRTPHDLARHNFISIRQADEAQGLLRLRNGRKSEAVRLRGQLSTNDGEVAVSWALAGLGVVLRAEWDVTRYLRSGRLVELLPAWETPPADIYAVYPERHAQLARVRAFADHLTAYFADQ